MQLATEASNIGATLKDFADPSKKNVGQAKSEFLRSNVTQLLDVCSELSTMCYTHITENEKLIEMGGSKLDRLCQMVSRIESATHLSSIESLEASVSSLNRKFDQLSDKLDGLSLNNPACEITRPTYATVSAKSRPPAPMPRRMSILLKPTVATPQLDTADKVKETLQKQINPVNKGWQVVGLRKKGEKEIVIDATSPEAAQKIINNADIKSCGLSATVNAKNSPRVIIYNIPRSMEDTEVLQALHSQNFAEAKKEEFLANIRPVFKTGRKDSPTTNHVFPFGGSNYDSLTSWASGFDQGPLYWGS
jgi:hypothetical protein